MSLQLLSALMASIGLITVGLTYDSPAAYFMFSAVVALLIVSYASARLSGRLLDLTRDAADCVFPHESFEVVLELKNSSRLPLFLVRVADSVSHFLQAEHEPSFTIAALWPRDTVRLTYRVQGLKRGVHRLGPPTLTISDPFGFFPSSVRLACPGEVIIYPRPLPLRAGTARSGMEARPITFGERARGSESGMEFYGIRDYQPGDELRRIHWAATAHHGRLTVIEFDRGVSDNFAVILDTCRGTEFGSGADTTLESGVTAAASLVHRSLEGEGVSFLAADSETGPHWVEVDRVDQENRALELLARVSADGHLPVSSLVHWAAPLLPQGTTVCIVTAAPDPDLNSAIQSVSMHLAAPDIILLLLDPSSFDPAAEPLAQAQQDFRIAGVSSLVVRREDDLKEALENVLATTG